MIVFLSSIEWGHTDKLAKASEGKIAEWEYHEDEVLRGSEGV